MSEDDWDSGFGKAVAVYLSGKGIGDCEPNGERITDDSFIVHFNSHPEPVEFNLPPAEFASTWTRVVSTTTANGNGNGNVSSDDVLKSSSPVIAAGLSLMLLKAGAAELAW
ncbi:MAG: isoamylase [Mycobacterium sp.]|jgi:isoamylase|nr:isoamylase [Mycobacterium sp.]MDT7790959.1 isoamylase [Mycobacterium sp.]